MKQSKLYAILSYMSWLGFLVALFLRDREDALTHRHLNQALLIHIVGSIGSQLLGRWWRHKLQFLYLLLGAPFIVIATVFFIMGFVRAIRRSESPLPMFGGVDWIQ